MLTSGLKHLNNILAYFGPLGVRHTYLVNDCFEFSIKALMSEFIFRSYLFGALPGIGKTKARNRCILFVGSVW